MKALKFLKYKGEFYQPGSKIVVDKADVEEFITKGLIFAPNLPEEEEFVEVEEVEEDNEVNLTKAEIRELLDEAGVDYNPKANKDELLALLEGEDIE